MGAKCGTGLRAGSELSSAVSQIGRRPGHLVERLSGALGLVCAKVGSACPVGKGPKSPSVQPRYREPYCFRLNDRKSCDAPTHLAKGEALPGRATEIDCQAWLGAAVSVLCLRPAEDRGCTRSGQHSTQGDSHACASGWACGRQADSGGGSAHRPTARGGQPRRDQWSCIQGRRRHCTRSDQQCAVRYPLHPSRAQEWRHGNPASATEPRGTEVPAHPS